MNERAIDLNADLGESPESLANGMDGEIMKSITSANIACGGHAGDEATMEQTIVLAKALKVAAGAHPGYPDRENFGRMELALAPDEIEAAVRDQINGLRAVAWRYGVPLVHVKPHGALYHAANQNREIAAALGRAVKAVDTRLIMVGQAGSAALDVWREMGLHCAREAFADRAYDPDGRLRKRTLPGALLEAARAAEQAVSIAVRGSVLATDGSEIPVVADTICIHSDTPGATAIADEVKQRLRTNGIHLRPLPSLLHL